MKTRPKVILVYPNQSREAFAKLRGWKFPNIHPRPFPMISLGMLYLVSAIEDICDVKYIDNNIQKMPVDALVQYIKNQKPDIVGFGGTLSEWSEAAEVAALLPNNICTVYGGPNATANPEKHVTYFDYVFRGWAENSFRQFILFAGWGVEIPGICSFGKIVSPSLDIKFPPKRLPARGVVNLDSYRRQQRALGVQGPVDIVVATRGCPFSCKFCSSKEIWQQKYAKREVGSVIAEIRFMHDIYGTKTVHFREDNLTIDSQYEEDLCKELRKLNKLFGIEWACQSRVDFLTEGKVRMMKDAGCRAICCGFESANDSTLEYINKGFTVADIMKTISILQEAKMNFSGGFMVGLPNEGEWEIKRTLEFSRWLSQQPYSFVPRGAGRFVGWPVSELYNEIMDNDLVAFNWEDGEMLIPHTCHLSARQVEDVIVKYW